MAGRRHGGLWLVVVVATECADLILYDGSHRYNTSRDTESIAAITAPLLGSAWVLGQDGEMLRNSGAAWETLRRRRRTRV